MMQTCLYIDTETGPSDTECPDRLASVLIVDDDTVAASELAESLEEDGISCVTVTTPDQAMIALDCHPSISAIVTDFYLRGDAIPAGNGLQLIDQIRDTFSARRFNFIVVSGDRDVLSDCMISGAALFLAKPVVPESIRTFLHEGPAQHQDPSLMHHGDQAALLQRMIRAQASTISCLSEILDESLKGRSDAAIRIDRLVSAASIACRRSDETGAPDVGDLMRYVVEQGYALKQVLGPDTKLPTVSAVATFPPTKA